MALRFGWVSCLVCGVVAIGCKVGPNYERPPVVTPANFRGAQPNAAAQESIANVPWWEQFKDPQLRDLITVALKENSDLKIAIERIEEARATYGISKADLYPHVNVQALGGGINPSDGSLPTCPRAAGVTPQGSITWASASRGSST